MKRLIASLFAGAVLVALALDEPARADQPAASFVAHEWGVWVVDEGGVAHLPALAAECPSFVIRAPRPEATPHGVPTIRASPVRVEKPVIFFHASQPIENVRVRVRFRRGAPWLIWPQARVSRRAVEWSGRISPRGGPELSPVVHQGATHAWWGHLRQAGGARFEPTDGSPAEDFLFYDGTMPFRSSFTFSQRDATWVPRRRGVESKVWVQDNQQVLAYDLATPESAGVVRPASSIHALLRAELRARGLRAGEADALLNTWRDDLEPPGQAPQPRAIYFVDRRSYDRMLPLTIAPTPDELVRVGLVIEMLRP